MSKAPNEVRGTISIEGDVATLRRDGDSSVIVARVLGRLPTPDGGHDIYLDRLLHRPEHDLFYGHVPRGAVSTILRCQSPSVPVESA